MVRRCAWGTCNADCRYPEKMIGIIFITFPNPKTKLEKCLRWIKACGRPHDQLNVDKIDKNKVICSKHFWGENGPTDEYPDPVPADGSRVTPTRPPPKRRRLDTNVITVQGNVSLEETINKENMVPLDMVDVHENLARNCDISCQTDKGLQDSFECQISYLKQENIELKKELSSKREEIKDLQTTVKQYQKKCEKQQKFCAHGIRQREKDLKKLFVYYTGITYVNFLFLFSFLFPNPEEQLKYGRRDTKMFSNENALLLLLCRLRHDFGLTDLAMRFNLSLQSTSVVFNTLLDLMYFKFGQVSIWPHRDVIIGKMPSYFKRDFPRTLIMIDGTEFKTQTPNALGLQSQMYSDYKSSTTLKALIGCDPSGTVIFISELFTGSISDKVICEESGFFSLLKQLIENGYIKQGDGIMADKGFTIHNELNQLGLVLNIPPFASCTAQMSAADTYLTQKIAKHRVHVERLIAKVKTYKLLSHKIPTSLFKQATKIWTICAILTLHQGIFVKDKL